jgi:DNA polymerase V
LIRKALNVFPVEDLWGVGRKNAKRLKEAGIHTALQFRECDSGWIRRNISVNGVRLQKELFGEVCYPLELKRNRKKNICTARSFGTEVKELSKLKEAISSYANTCARKLREEKSCCASISVFINTNPFKPQAKQYNPYKVIQLDVPTNDSMEIVKAALEGLQSIFRYDYIYKKAGVIVSRIISEEHVQLSLFDKLDRDKRKSINKAVDKLNSVMGREKVKLAVQGKGINWILKQEKLSPCYTTRFTDILEVRI